MQPLGRFQTPVRNQFERWPMVAIKQRVGRRTLSRRQERESKEERSVCVCWRTNIWEWVRTATLWGNHATVFFNCDRCFIKFCLFKVADGILRHAIWLQLLLHTIWLQRSTHSFLCKVVLELYADYIWLYLITCFSNISYLTIFQSFPSIAWFLYLVSTKCHDIIRFTSQPSTSQAATNHFATPGLKGNNGLRLSSSTASLKRTASFLMGVVKQLEWDEFGAWSWTIRM